MFAPGSAAARIAPWIRRTSTLLQLALLLQQAVLEPVSPQNRALELELQVLYSGENCGFERDSYFISIGKERNGRKCQETDLPRRKILNCSLSM